MIAVLLAFTWLFLTQGPLEPVLNSALATGLLAIASIIGSYAFSKPGVNLSMKTDGIHLSLRYPLKTERLHYHYTQIKAMRLVESKDSEGDPHFTTRITMADDRDIDLAEGSRDNCGAVLAQFSTALNNHLKATEAEHD